MAYAEWNPQAGGQERFTNFRRRGRGTLIAYDPAITPRDSGRLAISAQHAAHGVQPPNRDEWTSGG
jgi:hypothetical protein